MTDVSLRQLQYLVAIAEYRHFGDAAAMCNVSQPNLSAQLRELERSLGVRLVERSTRRVFLTPDGEEVVARARRVLTEVDGIVQVASASGDPLTGRMRLGVIPTVTPYALPRMLPAVRAAHPALELHLTEDITDRLVSRLLEGELDALLLALPIDSPGLSVHALIDEPFVLVSPASHPVTQLVDPSPADLDLSDLLLLAEGHCLRDQALEVCSLPRAGRGSAVEGTSLTTLVQMVANGLGVTLVPLLAASVEVTPGDELSIRRFPEPEPGRTLGLVWRSTSGRSEGLEMLAELFRTELERLVLRELGSLGRT